MHDGIKIIAIQAVEIANFLKLNFLLINKANSANAIIKIIDVALVWYPQKHINPKINDRMMRFLDDILLSNRKRDR